MANFGSIDGGAQNFMNGIFNDITNSEQLATDSTVKTTTKEKQNKKKKTLAEIIEIPNFSMMICSKRRTGKSVFMKDLVSQIHGRYKKCYVFSKSLKFQGNMYNFTPEDCKIADFDEARLKSIWVEQEKYITEKTENFNEAKEGISLTEYKKSLDHVLLILDDVIGSKGVRSSKVFDDLFILGRHLNLAVIVISQYYSSKGGISVIARKNLDYLVSFYLDTQTDKEHLVNDFISKRSKKEGLELYNKLTTERDYQCVIICNNVLSMDYNDYIYPYVANTDPPPFMIDGRKTAYGQFKRRICNKINNSVNADPESYSKFFF